MKRLAFAFAGLLALVAGASGPALADEPVAESYRAPPSRPARVVTRPRTIVREVVRERPVTVYRTRNVVREVVVERPVFVRPRPVYDEVFVDRPYGPPPFAYRRPFFRPRPVFAYGPDYYGPGPFRPRPYGWGWGRGPYF